ncbi:hypothetical protein P7K49_038118 [Saguinus oedipus]|uniref:Uncharacterized protein n=1 Tax=Saguinus oedipus TaxID=9490 RepID=A0ABQ9TF58_SAGOE|nr:hypothetical protein P7K49_038118 [Saguinus oedipus]
MQQAEHFSIDVSTFPDNFEHLSLSRRNGSVGLLSPVSLSLGSANLPLTGQSSNGYSSDRSDNWLTSHLGLPPDFFLSYPANYSDDSKIWRPVEILRLVSKYQNEISDRRICASASAPKTCSIERVLRKTERFQKWLQAKRLTPDLVQLSPLVQKMPPRKTEWLTFSKDEKGEAHPNLPAMTRREDLDWPSHGDAEAASHTPCATRSFIWSALCEFIGIEWEGDKPEEVKVSQAGKVLARSNMRVLELVQETRNRPFMHELWYPPYAIHRLTITSTEAWKRPL